MRANRRVSTREVLFRHSLWKAGVRGYRIQSRLPGRPDLTFPKLHLAVFVNGCFWHRCQKCLLPAPTANSEFWAAKFEENQRRDRLARARLESLGWDVMTIWEHEIRPDPTRRAADLATEIAKRRSRRPS
jgi:DNA mismatch endonuclease (patch repair protein)